MSYSYTEKRRIRKNFGRLPKVMELPKLIKTQLDSYTQFLQQHVEVGARENKGLEEVFQTLFPITSVSGNAALEYVSYELGKPGYSPRMFDSRSKLFCASQDNSAFGYLR